MPAHSLAQLVDLVVAPAPAQHSCSATDYLSTVGSAPIEYSSDDMEYHERSAPSIMPRRVDRRALGETSPSFA